MSKNQSKTKTNHLPFTFLKSGINKSLILFIPITFYAIGLFPGRIYRDSTSLLELMRVGESSDQWTALYFRYLQVTTINGKFLFLNAIIGLSILTLSFYWFMNSLGITRRTLINVRAVMIASPFLGVFGMTVGHDTTTASGVLLLVGMLIRLKKSQITKVQPAIVTFGFLLCSTSFLGFTAIIGFAFALGLVKRKALSVAIIGLTIFLFFFGSSILRVQSGSEDLRLTSLLGDIKCIAQHQDSNISRGQWVSIKQLAPETEWKAQTSCWIADNAYFALGAASKNPLGTAKLWANLAAQNPQILIMAHIQRASVALPPVFFSPPPNMIENNYAVPIGEGTADDLQKYSELFKTSVDDTPSKKMKLPLQSFFEHLALFVTFIFNQHSSLWGWAGLWLVTIILLGKKNTGIKTSDVLLFTAPLISMHSAMALVSPAPNPRYLMATTIIGITFCLQFVFDKTQSNH